MKLWSGRFRQGTDPLMDHFHSSLGFDWRLYKYDIAGSIAHATMLGDCGIIPQEDAAAICRGLRGIYRDFAAGRLELDPSAEDIHMFVETLLIQRIGDIGRKLHTARSRNDQVALDVRMYLRDKIAQVYDLVVEFQETLVDKARENMDVVMPGYTHLQRAQPVLLAHHLLAYVFMLERDKERLVDCFKRTNKSPLGAGALAGVAYPVDREQVARMLGFDGISENSMDAVSDRDFIVEFLSAASLIMTHLSRFSEEIVLWASAEFGFIQLDDRYSTGSSIMPQKKNPDVAELVRGKSGRVFGHLMGILTVMKGLPLAYNKDMQEDKEALFDGVDTVTQCLEIFIPMLRTMRVNREAMGGAVRKGFLNATDLADYLVRKAVPFRTAHHIVGQAVLTCIERQCGLEDLSLDELKTLHPAIESDVYDALSTDSVLRQRNAPGGTGPKSVAKQIARAEELLQKRNVPWEGKRQIVESLLQD